MAGIGFALRRLAREEGVLRPVASAGHGAVVAAGPWILTVAALGIVQRNLPRTGQDAYDLQALIIYQFCLSLVVTAPILAAALRLAADDLYLRQPERVRETFLAALLASVAATVAVALLVLGLGFGWRGAPLAAALASAGATGAIWPATAFCAATRDFGSITRAFAVGLALAVAGTLAGAGAGLPPAFQALLFAAGLWTTALWLGSRILATFPAAVPALRPPLARIAGTARRHPFAVAGAALAMVGIWADSWIMWFGPAGLAVASGLPTAPFYDSAMFVARLAMLPGLVLFLGSVDTGVFLALRRFLGTIENHGSLARIEREGAELSAQTNRLLVRLILAQATLTVVAVALAPAVVGPAGLLFQQLGILRFGTIAALFHVVFFAASTLLVLLGRERRFFLAQGAFLALNTLATTATIRLGPETYGAGYLAAATLAAILATRMLQGALRDIVYLTFADALAKARRPAGAGLREALRRYLPLHPPRTSDP